MSFNLSSENDIDQGIDSHVEDIPSLSPQILYHAGIHYLETHVSTAINSQYNLMIIASPGWSSSLSPLTPTDKPLVIRVENVRQHG